MHRLFERQVERTPAAVAVDFEGRELSYAELARQVCRLSSLLRRQGAGPGSRIGVLLSHSTDVVTAVLGILRAGAAFVPLDPDHPRAHRDFVIQDAGLSLVLTEPALADGLRGAAARCGLVSDIEREQPEEQEPPGVVSPDDPAYVMYTSGTTASPKGVLVPHRALANYVSWARELYMGEAALTFPLYSSLTFDLTLTSLFVPLIGGGKVVVCRGASSAASLMDALDRDGVDVVKLTPGHLSLVASRSRPGGRLRRLIVGGEALETKLVRSVLDRLGPHLEIINEYGPTEATVGCITHTYDAQRDSRDFVPIGRPAANTTAYVLDESMSPLPEGAVGQLYLAGDCLALGYLGDPDATRERFVASPFARGEILYRTGDLARWLPGGELDFVGRSDAQIKFNGHRVELDGLRTILGRHPDVRDAVVLLRKDEGDRGALVAYYASERPIGPAVLRSHMGASVSQEVIPQFFVHLPRLPLNLNGKIDTRSLPSLGEVKGQMRTMTAAPRTAIEAALATIWRTSLGVPEVGVDDDFFDLGGHSLLANQIILRIREALDIDLNMRSIFENRTVAALARSIERARTNNEVRVASEAAQPPEGSSGGLPELALALDARRAAGAAPAAPARTSDEENLGLAGSVAAVDGIVGAFYSRFPWPWNSSKFDTLTDPDFERVMLSQEVGDFSHAALPRQASIWVAGCGTNQALLTALRFPDARVLGTDLSTQSIEICAANAAELGVKNLDLKLESINEAPYREEFDFVLCTGVIHHTYEPAHALGRLSTALKRDGMMEVLVYNRFHRTITSAFQKAIRIMTRGLSADDLAVAKRLAAGFAVDNTMARFIGRHRDWEESDFADLLINPVEHSYTIDSLAEMASGCNLELVRPCISLYAKYRAESIFWEMSFSDPDIQRVFDAMPDLDRWRVSNLLMHEKSPMLWFYLQRKDSTKPRRSEKQLNDELLLTTLERATTTQKSYIRGHDGRFRASARTIPYPSSASDDSVKAIYERFDRPRVLGEVITELGIEPSFSVVQRARLQLTTPSFPYLRAVERPRQA